jgi:hypothetical protein
LELPAVASQEKCEGCCCMKEWRLCITLARGHSVYLAELPESIICLKQGGVSVNCSFNMGSFMYQLTIIKVRRRWGQRHAQGANSGSNGKLNSCQTQTQGCHQPTHHPYPLLK